MYTCECDAINPVLCVGLQRQICVPRYALRKGKASCPMVPRASPARVSLTTHENEPIYCSAVYLLCMCVVYIYIYIYICIYMVQSKIKYGELNVGFGVHLQYLTRQDHFPLHGHQHLQRVHRRGRDFCGQGWHVGLHTLDM